MATRTRLRGAPTGNDEAEDRPAAEHLRGPAIHRHGAPEGRGVHRHQVREGDHCGYHQGSGIRRGRCLHALRRAAGHRAGRRRPHHGLGLRALKVGHVVVNSAVDRPWSQYFCCLATGHREFVKRHPIATKRALRAILKGADLCVLEPERAARALVDGGFTPRYDYALQTMKDVPYNKWRVYDPEDSLRFYALRLREAGMIKSTPQRLIAQGTDWRVLNQAEKGVEGRI